MLNNRMVVLDLLMEKSKNLGGEGCIFFSPLNGYYIYLV